jgi:hypothetical protein
MQMGWLFLRDPLPHYTPRLIHQPLRQPLFTVARVNNIMKN